MGVKKIWERSGWNGRSMEGAVLRRSVTPAATLPPGTGGMLQGLKGPIPPVLFS